MLWEPQGVSWAKLVVKVPARSEKGRFDPPGGEVLAVLERHCEDEVAEQGAGELAGDGEDGDGEEDCDELR